MRFKTLSLTWTYHEPFHFTFQLLSISLVVKNNKINRIHERCLRIIYNDKKSTFYQLLGKDGSVSIHKRNLRFLACEMFQLKRGMAPELIKELLLPNRQHSYELRNNPDFVVPIVKSVHKVLKSLSYLSPKLWELLPLETKKTETLLQFKAKIKK